MNEASKSFERREGFDRRDDTRAFDYRGYERRQAQRRRTAEQAFLWSKLQSQPARY